MIITFAGVASSAFWRECAIGGSCKRGHHTDAASAAAGWLTGVAKITKTQIQIDPEICKLQRGDVE